jgi:hypothetical protein
MKKENDMQEDMELALDNLIDRIVEDYSLFTKDFKSDRLDQFHAGLTINEGKKYFKIIKGDTADDQTSVWGFVVKEDGPKFKRGDILKPAGWKAPATNKARGNILGDDYQIAWTGPLYL